MGTRKSNIEDVASLRTIPEGKVIDFITGKLLNDTPEEYVRQNIAMSLILEYNYERSQIEIEFPIKIGTRRVRVDIAIFPTDAPHEQEYIATIIETKRESIKPDSKKDGVDQLKSYMASSINCDYGMWTNGDYRACFKKHIVDTGYVFLDSIDILPAGMKNIETPSRSILRSATGDNLLFAFRRCHNYIAGNQGLQKPEAFWELLKLIFCKIEDERSMEDNLQFFVNESERMTMNGQTKVKARIQKIFSKTVIQKYSTIFKQNENIEMDARVVAYVVSELQQYSLLNSPVDVKGVAYEAIVGSNLRGDRGEFFTPRNACRMAVTMLNPQPHHKILDPACGTGGFLVTAMNHVLQNLEKLEKEKWASKEKPTRYELDEFYRKRNEYLTNNIIGLDLNPNLVRAAKMNMVMNNDGSGQLFQCNSLEDSRRWADTVRDVLPVGSIDILFTNPPFGSNILIDDPQVLKQYDLAAQWLSDGKGEWMIKTNTKGEKVLQASQPPEILFVERCMQLLKPGTGCMAMVMPNGLLNNPGLEYFRFWLFSKAQILAVVDMQRDLFMPGNDTQTSMVLLRRKAPGEKERDYPIFMAISEAIGHDKRGNTLYKRNPDGSIILEEAIVERIKHINHSVAIEKMIIKKPLIDDELDEIAIKYRNWIEDAIRKIPRSYIS